MDPNVRFQLEKDFNFYNEKVNRFDDHLLGSMCCF